VERLNKPVAVNRDEEGPAMKLTSSMAYPGPEEMMFGTALKPVETKSGVKIGGGALIPEIVPHPRPGSEKTIRTLLREFERANEDALERCVRLGFPAIVIENEHVFQMTHNPDWGMEIASQSMRQIEDYRAKYGIKAAYRSTIADIRRPEKADLRTSDRSRTVLEAFEACAQHADIISIESIGGKEIFERTEKGDWKTFAKIGWEDELTVDILGFDSTGKVIYLKDSRSRDTAALYAYNLETGEKTIIAEDAKVDLDGRGFYRPLIHPTEKNVQAVAAEYDRMHWKIIDPSIKDDIEYLRTVNDGDFFIESRTLDDKAWTVVYMSDDGPLAYYYYDRDARNARFLFTLNEKLESEPLAKMIPVIIKSRDGLDLVSYYTLPSKSDSNGDDIPDRPLPMVLLVHGGPEGRDYWGLNSIHQLLANRGYAVLSINFRGSTGFGKNFTNAGKFEYGRKMQYDLIDGVDWAVTKGIADPDRVGIMGGSYGGYAVLAGLAFTPETFACGVDMYGPSNLITLLDSEQEIEEEATSIGDPRTEEGQKLLAERSPLNYVDRIQRPLLVEQGANDPIVKRNESDQIVQVMQEKNLSVTYVLFPDEGHYIARPENNIAFYAVAESFLAQHLGGRFEFIDDDLQGSSITVPVGAEEIPGLEVALSEKTP